MPNSISRSRESSFSGSFKYELIIVAVSSERIDRACPEGIYALSLQVTSQRLRLTASYIVERNGHVALQAPFAVEIGLAVSNEQDSLYAHATLKP